MYVVIETGSKQYKVSEGDIIQVEKLDLNAGDNIKIENVLMVSDNDNVVFGTPYINGASVSASVVGNGKAKKVIIYKYKAKKGFHKKKGHRQPFTKLKIDRIDAIKA